MILLSRGRPFSLLFGLSLGLPFGLPFGLYGSLNLPLVCPAEVEPNCMHTGKAQLDVQDGTFRQEPGSGVWGQVQGATVAVGNLDWVRSHMQQNPSAETSTTNSHISESRTISCSEQHGDADAAVPDHSLDNLLSRSNGNSSGASSSSSGSNSVDSGGHSSGSFRGGDGPASTSGKSGSGLMTVYVGVNGSLAGVFEIRDQLRPDAAATIRGLQQQGIDTILLSGRHHSYNAVSRYAVLCCAVLCR